VSDKIKNIRKRKEKLKQEIRELQDELDESIHEARDDLSTRLKPRNLIREYPLTSVGLTFLAGFLLGPRDNDSGSSKTVKRKSSTDRGSSNGVSAHMWSEIKRSVSKRAVRLLMEYLDDIIAANTGSGDTKRRDS
jgi:predicted transcriptional regulator